MFHWKIPRRIFGHDCGKIIERRPFYMYLIGNKYVCCDQIERLKYGKYIMLTGNEKGIENVETGM
jgi:hypothetical protein